MDGWDAVSYELEDYSNDMWSTSIDFSGYADEAWIQGDTEAALDWQYASSDAEWLSNELDQASWDAWYGPVNADGYTAMDVSHGYSATDTSFIEPASSSGSCSLISDNDATSVL